jgi:enoyl-CoA hydratase/carnithine racemase
MRDNCQPTGGGTGAEAASSAELVVTQRVSVEAGEIAVLTLNRPEQRNPIDFPTIQALRAAVEELSTDGGPGAIVITGAGPAFSAGGDLKAYQTLYRDPARFIAFMAEFGSVCALLERCRPIVIAMVNGSCVAGGLELSLACDFITIAETARIGDGHLTYGQLPGAGGSQRLVRAIGVQRARQWLLTGQLFPAQHAVDIGLATLMAPAPLLRERTLTLAAQVIRHTPLGLHRMKQLIGTAQTTPLTEGLVEEMNVVCDYATTSYDANEGLNAFAERRAPRYLGR